MSFYEIKNDEFVVENDLQTMSISGRMSSLRAWHLWENGFSNEKHRPVSICGGIPVVLTTDLTDQMKAAIAKAVPFPAGLGDGMNDIMACTACRKCLPFLLRMRDFEGDSYFMPGPKARYPVNFWPLWDASRSGPITGVSVVTPNQFGDYTLGGFKHFAVDTPTDFLAIGDVDARQRLLDKKRLDDDNPPINGSILLRSGGTEFTIN